jgi:hypothetical protein
MVPNETYEWQCTICGEVRTMRYGELHDCPGFPPLGDPPSKFEPLPSVFNRLGREAAERMNTRFWKLWLELTT